MYIDSHCHLNMLDLKNYDDNLNACVTAAENVGVNAILNVATELTTAPAVIAVAEQFPHVYASVGLHPSEQADPEPGVEDIVALARHDKVVAIGETGLDYYYNDSGLDNMRERFRKHVRAALEVNKPLIIHTRDARDDTINILREEKADQVRGVMHCFTENLAMAEQAMALGFYISFSGIVTFKNAANVAEVAKEVPLDRILIETDAPFLTPVPFRGKPNEPAHVRFVAKKIAELKGLDETEVARVTSQNFHQLFLR